MAASGPVVRVITGLMNTVRFTERYPNAWKKRSSAAFVDTESSPAPAARTSPPAVTPESETSSHNPAFPTVAGRGNLALSGLSDQGTRLHVHFQNVPTVVRLYTNATGVMTLVSTGVPTAGRVRLINAGVSGEGAFAPTPAGLYGIAETPVVGTTADAWFEVLEVDAFTREYLELPIYVAYNSPATGTSQAHGTFAPVSAVTTASELDPGPRFGNIARRRRRSKSRRQGEVTAAENAMGSRL